MHSAPKHSAACEENIMNAATTYTIWYIVFLWHDLHTHTNALSHVAWEEKADDGKGADADHIDHFELLIVLLVSHPGDTCIG